MVHYKLIYFDIRGIAEAIRLVFKYAKVDFEDNRLTFEQWPTIKPTTPFGKLPILEIDGTQLVESAAIARFIARKHGLAGKGDLEEAKVDAIVDQNKDFMAQVYPWLLVKFGREKGDEEELKKTKLIPNAEIYLSIFQKYIKESGSGFLVKSGVTFADFIISEFVITLRQNAPDVIDKYPEMLQYIDRLKALPQLKDHYASRKE
uniref:glutathione transferase n=1 Tax=Panagrolaimus davidi TaxID=227884 RepID=A0A914QE52_9BILA